MPPKVPFQRAEKERGHPAEVKFLDVTVLYVVRNVVRKNVLDMYVARSKPVLFKEFTCLAPRVGVGDRTARLRFRIPGNELLQFPKAALARRHKDRADLPGIAMINHDLENGSRPRVLAQLFEYSAGKWGMMDHAEGIDQIVRFYRNKTRQLFRIRQIELH